VYLAKIRRTKIALSNILKAILQVIADQHIRAQQQQQQQQPQQQSQLLPQSPKRSSHHYIDLVEKYYGDGEEEEGDSDGEEGEGDIDGEDGEC
jgi:hypothetical protein